jgi:hypothetical protein
LDKSSGDKKWHFDTGGPVKSAVTVTTNPNSGHSEGSRVRQGILNHHNIWEESASDWQPGVSITYSPQQPRSNDVVELIAKPYGFEPSENLDFEWDLDDDGHTERMGKKVIHKFKEGKHKISLQGKSKSGTKVTNSKVIEVLPEKANIQLTGHRTEVQPTENAVIILSAANFLTNKELTVQLLIETSSGISVTGVSGAEGSNQYTAVSTVQPGGESNIRITLEPNQPGEFDVSGTAVYYFGEDEANSERFTESVTITTRPRRTEDPSNQQGTSEGQVSGFGFGAALGGLAGSVALRKWIQNTDQDQK